MLILYNNAIDACNVEYNVNFNNLPVAMKVCIIQNSNIIHLCLHLLYVQRPLQKIFT